MASSSTRLALAGSAFVGLGVAAAAWQPAASAGQPRKPPEAEALQVLADVVLIESQCRQFAVDYGKLFAFAERNGIRPVEIMPAGDRRAAFDAAYKRRARTMSGDDLCATLASERDATIPGVFTAR